jgi:O-antigen ligase
MNNQKSQVTYYKIIRQPNPERKYIMLMFGFAGCLLLSNVNSALTLVINSFILPVIWIGLLKSDYFDASIIPMAFFFNYFGMSFGVISIVWIYLFLYLFKFLFIKKISLTTNELLVIAIIGGLQIPFPITGSIQEGLKYIGFLLCTVILFSRNNRLSSFEPIFLNLMLLCSASALISITGIAQIRVITLDEGIFRYTAGGIQDPNYSSFLMLLGFISALSFQPGGTQWKIIVKICSILLCLLTILRSVSISGILGMIIIVLSYLLLQKGVVRKFKVILFVIVIVVLVLSILSIYFPSVLDSISWRINLILHDYSDVDINGMTSNRLSINERYLSYFFNQGILKILFGLRSMPNTNLVQILGAVTHNSYVDMLFMYGIIGVLIILLLLIKKNIVCYKKNRIKHNSEYQFIILCSILLAFFSFTLSIIPTVEWIVIYFIRRVDNE